VSSPVAAAAAADAAPLSIASCLALRVTERLTWSIVGRGAALADVAAGAEPDADGATVPLACAGVLATACDWLPWEDTATRLFFAPAPRLAPRFVAAAWAW
jgi:hypothetical protein